MNNEQISLAITEFSADALLAETLANPDGWVAVYSGIAYFADSFEGILDELTTNGVDSRLARVLPPRKIS